ncbi:MAG TPA: DUF58 domain-containing protein [Myxococcales bacterium]|nr:DUF58 domain-containing protein [Myxococcales bacterium]
MSVARAGALTARGRVVPAWKRRLSFTPLGRWYVALTVAIGFAAINTGNNLLFLVLGLLLSSIVVSGILSETSLRAVRVERRLPISASVGAEALVALIARNLKPRAPSVGLTVREKGGDVAGRGLFLVLGPGRSEEVSYRFTPARRGVHRFDQLEVATRAPFGLFEKVRPLSAPAELIVFPRRIAPPPLEPRQLAREGESSTGRAGHGLEMHALRDYRPGEDARSIHWRSSARLGKLIGVDREQERRRQVCVVLDHRRARGAALETAVERAAALFERELDSGAEVSLALCGDRLPAGSGERHRIAGLTLLALLDAGPGAPAPVPDRDASVLEVVA